MNDPGKYLSQSSDEADAEIQEIENEFDEYDLLGAQAPTTGAPSSPGADLSGMTKAFNTRIQRKKREQEEAHDIAERAARERHHHMLSAMVNIRKSLREVIRIDLGDRFEFSLLADDWFGWPRLTIRLVDLDLVEEEYPKFVVTASDRNQSGLIEIVFNPNSKPERIHLTGDAEMARLPAWLRKCVRAYLDMVGDLVLEAEKKKEQLGEDDYIEKKDMGEFEEAEPEAEALLNADLFEDDSHESDILEALPALEDIEALPDLGKPE